MTSIALFGMGAEVVGMATFMLAWGNRKPPLATHGTGDGDIRIDVTSASHCGARTEQVNIADAENGMVL